MDFRMLVGGASTDVSTRPEKNRAATTQRPQLIVDILPLVVFKISASIICVLFVKQDCRDYTDNDLVRNCC